MTENQLYTLRRWKVIGAENEHPRFRQMTTIPLLENGDRRTAFREVAKGLEKVLRFRPAACPLLLQPLEAFRNRSHIFEQVFLPSLATPRKWRQRAENLLLNESVRAHMGHEAAERCAKLFDVQLQIATYLEWYAEILGNGARESSQERTTN